MAVFAVVLIPSVSSAAAAELPEFSVETAGEATGKTGELESKLGNIQCTASVSRLGAGRRLGTITISFTGCNANVTLGEGSECHSLADPSGTILTGGEWHVVPGPRQSPRALVLILLRELHVECKNRGGTIRILFLIRGDVLGTITPLGVRVRSFTITIRSSKDVQELLTFENDEGREVTAKLEVSTNAGKSFEAGGENAGETKLATEKETDLEK